MSRMNTMPCVMSGYIRSIDLVEVMAHAFLFGAHVAEIVVVGSYFDRHVFFNRESISFKAEAFHRVVRHQAHAMHAESVENLGTYAIVALVGLVTEMQIGIDGVKALLLKLVGLDLIHQSYAAAFLIQIKDNSASLLLDHFHSFVELIAAVAALGAEDVAGGA